MTKEMIISSNGHETRVAILEDDQLAEIFVERERNRGVVGNVYKGRVSKVLPGMQSSFIDIGLERDGFLYVSDVITDLDEFDQADDDAEGGKAKGEGAEREREREPEAKIEELLKEGQDVVVQVAKEPLGTKGARLTGHVTLPGRFLVFMPTVDHIGISRKIATREERARLRAIVREFREQHAFGGGVIIHAAAEGGPRTTSWPTCTTSTRSGSRCARSPRGAARRR
ncbi:MAG: ribonuclease E/G [Vicinamibacterales bacterium]